MKKFKTSVQSLNIEKTKGFSGTLLIAVKIDSNAKNLDYLARFNSESGGKLDLGLGIVIHVHGSRETGFHHHLHLSGLGYTNSDRAKIYCETIQAADEFGRWIASELENHNKGTKS